MKNIKCIMIALLTFLIVPNFINAAKLSLTVGDTTERYELLEDVHEVMDGKVKVTPDDGENYDGDITLYLDNYDGSYIEYFGNGDLTIILSGTNKITDLTERSSTGIFTRNNLKIEGPGSLEIIGFTDGIRAAEKNIEISYVKLKLSGMRNTSIMSENLNISNSDINISTELYGTFIRKQAKFTNSNVTISSGDGYDEFLCGDGVEDGFSFVGYDPLEVYLGETNDGENLITWDQQENLSDECNVKYRYLKLEYKPKVEGKIKTNSDNDKFDILSNIELTEFDNTMQKLGVDINVFLKVSESKEDIPLEEQKLIEENIGEGTLAEYLDVSLFKQIGNFDEEKITTLGSPIKLSFTLTDELLNKEENKKRTYKVIRVHEGKVDTLNTTYDEETKLLTFETDRFSSYALAYEDEDIINNPETNDNISLYMIIGLISLMGVGVTIYLKNKES